MTNTGVFLTDEERDEIKKLYETATTTPVITFGGGGPDAASVAFRRMHDRLDELAKGHGLPEPVGHYGLDMKTGEIVAH